MTAELGLAGVVSERQLRQTVAYIASQQQSDGLIPWFTGHHADPWDHVESAMALAAGGLIEECRAAFIWSAAHQRSDGSWPMQITGTEVRDSSSDANQCMYVATGLWHHWLLTQDRSFVSALWPTARRAVQFGLELQQPSGAIAWSRDPLGVADRDALLTGSACMVLSLRCAMALADLLDDPQPDWELSAARLAHAVAVHPTSFADKSRFSMDWYYPILGGAVTGVAAQQLIDQRWIEFVLPGRGILCVADRPWITGAETCELALTLDVVNDANRAHRLLRDMQFLRTPAGGYRTGWVMDTNAYWPDEQSTWTSAAVILAADALARHTPANGIFRGTGLPQLLDMPGCTADCDSDEQEMSLARRH